MKDLVEMLLAYPTWVKVVVILLGLVIVILLVFFHPAATKELEKQRLEANAATPVSKEGATAPTPVATEPPSPVSPPPAALSIDQTPGSTLQGDFKKEEIRTYAKSVDVTLTNILGSRANVTDLRISWKKLGEPVIRFTTEGNLEGAMPIDRFVVRLAAENVDSANCIWTFTKKFENGELREEFPLKLPHGNSIAPRKRVLALEKNEPLLGEIVLDAEGLFEVEVSGALREIDKREDTSFNDVFRIYR